MGVSAHVGQVTVRLSVKPGPLEGELAEKAQSVADTVIREAHELVEIEIDAKNELDPEDAPTHSAILPFADQHGIVVRADDPDDNDDSNITKLRFIGLAEAADDVAALLRARFVEGKSVASVLQVHGQVQAMSPS